MQHRLRIKESTHGPTRIETKKITQHGTTGTKAIAAEEGTNAGRLYYHCERTAGLGISYLWPADFIKASIPGTSQVHKLH